MKPARKPIATPCETEVLIHMRLNSTRELFSSQVARSISFTQAGVYKTITDLVNRGFIGKKETGRKNIVWLTEKGNRVADLLRELKQEMQD